MKKLFIFLFYLSATGILLNKAHAQSSKCLLLNSFTGEWRYANGQDTIRVYFRAQDYTIITSGVPDQTISCLRGWHQYKQGSTIIESNYGNRFMTLPATTANETPHSYSIMLQMPQCDTSRHNFIGMIDDITQCYEYKNVTAQFNTSLNQITWTQQRAGYVITSGCTGMTLPGTFVLTKQ
ncbi:MAG: DUF6705 family protein [Flavobacterium sp.]